MIVLNLKTYEKSLEKALYYVDVASEVVEETGVRIIVCPPIIHLKESAERFSDIFAQHTDYMQPGAHTGSLPPEALKRIKVRGSLVNHSEKKLPLEAVKNTIERLHINSLESIACTADLKETKKVAEFLPTYIAIEPPELIGSGISVSTAKPEVVKESVRTIELVNDKIIPLCGAGVSTKQDVAKALALGSRGVLLASAYVNAKDPKEFLRGLASVF
ncbi:MAG: triose-phosphate isomerase [Candidatus Micrarchaeota archaeon]